MKPAARTTFALIVVCFLLSGIAGLAYQVVWSRYLGLLLGNTSYAVVAVLVAFMGGLAIGNAWFGARADRSQKPLALYGWLEIGIGVYALFFPSYFEFCRGLFLSAAKGIEPGAPALLALKFGFSFMSILLPTIMMGATLPVLTKFVTRALSELREKVAALYAINSAGAVAGVLIADFWWVPSLGLEGTVFAGAALNLVVGVVSLLLSFGMKEGKSAAPAEPAAASDTESFSPIEIKLALIGIGVSGFIAMLYEVAWTRLLGLVLGSSTHAFGLMLVTFISGIAVGAWIVYRWKSRISTVAAFGWAELALGATLLVSMFFYEYLPYLFAWLASLLARTYEAYPFYHLLQVTICMMVMFVPAVCLGVTLPLVTRIMTAEFSRTGRSVGKVFAVNTLGTVLGAVVTGLWLMPGLGLARTIAIGIAGNILLGVAVLGRNRLAGRPWMLAPFAAAGLAIVILAGWRFEDRWQRALLQGLWRSGAPGTLADFQRASQGLNIKYYKDGASATVAIQSVQDGGQEHIALRVNGKADASTGRDVSTQRLSGHIPMLLRLDAKRGLVIGLGSGMTAAAAARHPAVERIDVVEISPEVAEAAQFFAPYNDDVLKNPKVKLHIEDAKTFLHLTEQPYDVIISEPSNPWMAGVAGVFSQEYYEVCKNRLTEGGMMVQWVQIYETDDETISMVFRTFGSVFPHMSVWRPSIGDLLLVGSTQPLKTDLDAIEQRFNHPAIKSDLAKFDLNRLVALLSRQVVSAADGVFIPATEGPVHSDYLPLLEYMAQRVFFVRGRAEIWQTGEQNHSPRPSTLLGEYLQKRKLTEDDYKAMALYFMTHQLPDPSVMRSLASRWLAEFPESPIPVQLTAQLRADVTGPEAEALRLKPSMEFLLRHAAEDPEPLRIYESYLMQTHRMERSAFHIPSTADLERVLHRLLETNPQNQRAYKLHLAEIAWDQGDDAKCFSLAQSAFDPDPAKGGPVTFSTDPRAPRVVLARMMETLWRAGEYREAAALADQAYRNGYAGEHASRREPILEAACRKVMAYALAAGAAGAPAP